jgi:uncharacterized protein YdaU (DUF1376 family)
MNSELYNNVALIPQSLLDHLNDCFSSTEGDVNIEGWKRNQELRDQKSATYQQIKRIKNWFDSYSGNKEDAPFILNGGDRMHKWCDEVLRVWRDDTLTSKQNKSDAGMQNQHISAHYKLGIGTQNQTTTQQLTISMKEEVEAINKLIKKII